MAGYYSRFPEGEVPPPTSPFRRPPSSSAAGSRTVLFIVAILFVAQLALCAGRGGIGDLFFGLVLIAIVVSVAANVAVWILRPIDQASREVRAPLQFSLVDFLCLFLLVQLPMALIHGLLTDEEAGVRWTFDIYAWLAVAAFWSASVHVLSRAGIRNPRQRALFLAFIAPSALFGAIGLPCLTGYLLISLYQALFEGTGFSPQPPGARAAAVAVYGLLLVCVYVSGRLTRRMVAFPSCLGDRKA